MDIIIIIIIVIKDTYIAQVRKGHKCAWRDSGKGYESGLSWRNQQLQSKWSKKINYDQLTKKPENWSQKSLHIFAAG